MSTVGFIGLGNIGCPMSLNLVSSGIDVLGYDIQERPDFVEAGGRMAASATEVAAEANIIVQSLPTTQALVDTVDHILPVARSGQIVIELSTYPINVKRDQAQRFADKGVRMLDCEVSGLPEMVRQRKAVIFQAGEKSAIDEAEHVFEALADLRFYLGEFGTATKMKLLANLLVCVHNLAAAEVINLGAKADIDPELIFKVLGPSAAGSAIFTNKVPRMISRDFMPGPGPFKTIFKYLDLVKELSEDTGAATPMMDTARLFYDVARKEIEQGQRSGDQDIAAMLEIIEAAQRNSSES